MSLASHMAEITEEIIYTEMSEMDYLLICFIRDLRILKGITQLQLSQRMKLADGFVSKVETFSERAKYSIRHLPLIAKAFDCSIPELIPKEAPLYDQVRLTIKRTNRTNKDGSISRKKITKVIKVEQITRRSK